MLDVATMDAINKAENQIVNDLTIANRGKIPTPGQVQTVLIQGNKFTRSQILEYYGIQEKPLPSPISLIETVKSGKQMAADFIARLNRIIDNEKDFDEFISLADELNLDLSELDDTITYKSLQNLRAAVRNLHDCFRCNGKFKPVAGQCYKYHAEVVEGEIQLSKTPCYRADAVKFIEQSGIPMKFKNMRGDCFRVNEKNETAADSAFKSIDNNRGLFIYGPVRTGKTLLCSIIVNERAYIGKPSYFVTVTDMLDELRDFDDAVARRNKLSYLKTCQCLIIDDLGAEYQTDWVASTLFSILDTRYKNELQTIINSNFSLDELSSRIKGYHGERISRRIRDMCDVVYIG